MDACVEWWWILVSTLTAQLNIGNLAVKLDGYVLWLSIPEYSWQLTCTVPPSLYSTWTSTIEVGLQGLQGIWASVHGSDVSGSYQVTLVSPDLVDPRCIGSRLSLPASISVVSIPDPLDPFLVNHSIIILKHSTSSPLIIPQSHFKTWSSGSNIYYYSF